MITVAALYVDPRGPYPSMPGVECWDETRDARNYAGPHPVVAHPPCGPWGALAQMRVPNRERRTQDIGCAEPAVAAVRLWGGVLEQPARSAMFRAFGMPSPFGGVDYCGGWTFHCSQVHWGHPAEKQSWVYVVGFARFLPMPPFPGRRPTHWVSGGRKLDRKGSGGVVPAGIKVCSSGQRRRTPPAFAEFLVDLARQCRKTESP